jgi:hypothetical protein
MIITFLTSSYGWLSPWRSSTWGFFFRKKTPGHILFSILHGVLVGARGHIQLFFGSLKCTDNKSLPQSHSFFLAFQNMPENGRQGKHVSMGTGMPFQRMNELSWNETWLSFIHIGWNHPLEQMGVWGGGGIWGYPRTSYNTPFLGYLLSFLLISRGLIFDFDFFWSFKKKLMGFFDWSMTKKLWWNCGQSKNKNHPLLEVVLCHIYIYF